MILLKNNLINRLYEEIYAPKITPFELVENAKLDNYLYVNMFKEDGYLWVETCCYIDENSKATFKYKFDMNDCLITLTSFFKNETTVQYNREDEINKLINKIKDTIPKELEKLAI